MWGGGGFPYGCPDDSRAEMGPCGRSGWGVDDRLSVGHDESEWLTEPITFSPPASVCPSSVSLSLASPEAREGTDGGASGTWGAHKKWSPLPGTEVLGKKKRSAWHLPGALAQRTVKGCVTTSPPHHVDRASLRTLPKNTFRASFLTYLGDSGEVGHLTTGSSFWGLYHCPVVTQVEWHSKQLLLHAIHLFLPMNVL